MHRICHIPHFIHQEGRVRGLHYAGAHLFQHGAHPASGSEPEPRDSPDRLGHKGTPDPNTNHYQRSPNRYREKLRDERTKLLQAHYAGAVPLDLLKTEQDRIGHRIAFLDARIEAGEIEYDQARAHLDDCLALAGAATRST